MDLPSGQEICKPVFRSYSIKIPFGELKPSVVPLVGMRSASKKQNTGSPDTSFGKVKSVIDSDVREDMKISDNHRKMLINLMDNVKNNTKSFFEEMENNISAIFKAADVPLVRKFIEEEKKIFQETFKKMDVTIVSKVDAELMLFSLNGAELDLVIVAQLWNKRILSFGKNRSAIDPLFSSNGTSFPDYKINVLNALKAGVLPCYYFSKCAFSKKKFPTAWYLTNTETSRLRVLDRDGYIITAFDSDHSSCIALGLAAKLNIPTQDPTSHMTPWLGNLMSSMCSLLGHSEYHDNKDQLRVAPVGNSDHVMVSCGDYSLKCYFEKSFKELRKGSMIKELDYITSLSRSVPWPAKGGKSKATFAKTLDDRYIIKEIKANEVWSADFADMIFAYMRGVMLHKQKSFLTKIFGLYELTVNGKVTPLVVMENLVSSRNINMIYDLKGNTYNRLSKDPIIGQDAVFVNNKANHGFIFSAELMHEFLKVLAKDTEILMKCQVMDYSLLVGIDSERSEVVCGLIDYFGQYTVLKSWENFGKQIIAPIGVTPTIVPPEYYRERLLAFIRAYFPSFA